MTTAPNEFFSLEDFETLFVHQWFQDFPVGSNEGHQTGVASDWTIHAASCVKRVAASMGLFAYFENKDFDGTLYDVYRQLVARVEWEWQRADGQINEIRKLAQAGLSPPAYAVFLGYVHQQNEAAALAEFAKQWKGNPSSLLVILVLYNRESVRGFIALRTWCFDGSGKPPTAPRRDLPALPWALRGSRWFDGQTWPAKDQP